MIQKLSMLIIYLFSFPKSCRYTQFYTKWWFHLKKYLHRSELVTSVKLVWNLTGPILGTPMDSGIYITQHFETTSFLSNSSTKYKKKKVTLLTCAIHNHTKRPTFLPPSTAENHTGIEKNGYNV